MNWLARHMVAASMAWVFASATASSGEDVPRGELEAFKRQMQDVVSQNRELARRVRELEKAIAEQEQAADEGAKKSGRRATKDEKGKDAAGEVAEEESAKDPAEEAAEEESGKDPTEVAQKKESGEDGPEEAAEGESAKDATEEAADKGTIETAKESDEASEEQQTAWSRINKYVVFGGVVEVQGGWRKDLEEGSESFISLETAEIDFEVQANKWTNGKLVLEYDSEGNKVAVDEAYLTLGDVDEFPLLLTTGRTVVPFGISTGDPVADTLTISDPLTLEIFETLKDHVRLGAEARGFNADAYAFRSGPIERSGENHVEKFGGTVGYRTENDHWSLDLDLDFISSVFDSDGLIEEFPEPIGDRYSPGIAGHVKARMNKFSLVAEYNGALDETRITQDDETISIAPKAWQIQLGYETEGPDKGMYVAADYSQSYELGGIFPQRRVLLTVGKWLFYGLRLALEYGHEWDYPDADRGTGRQADAFITQLTYEW